MAATQLNFPEKLHFLFQSHKDDGTKIRYKIAHGGRGSGKSWGFARALIALGLQRPLRVLCARELQSSIRDSVHKLLKDQIEALGLLDHYEIQRDAIIGRGQAQGTEFIFEGIRHNVQKIKSTEGIDVCWIEEGALISKESLDVLVPTIRKEGSEIWITFNPDQEEDEVYQRFVKNTPKNAVVQEINYWDNPWFPQTLKEEMETAREQNYDDYLWIWEGKPRRQLEGAVYAGELRLAEQQKRICKVPYDPTVGVHVFVDLGWADMTVLWFVQKVAHETRYISYYENQFKAWDHYLQFAQSKGYIIDTIWLPHDAKAKSLGTGKSIEELTRAKGFKVQIVPRLSIQDGINAARTIFVNAWFDENECALGLHALRKYRYEQNPITKQFTREPKHDEASHGSDGFRYSAVGMRAPKTKSGFFQGASRHPDATIPLVDETQILTGLPGKAFGAAKQSAIGWMRR